MSVALGIQAGQRCCSSTQEKRTTLYKWFTLIFTFFIYCSYHISRKPISVVKSVLNPDNCSVLIVPGISPNQSSLSRSLLGHNARNISSTHCGWAPFDGPDGNSLLGSLDIAFLFPYAIGMFVSGHIAERVNLRYFLAAGMLLSGASSILFGCAYFWNIHVVSYFIAMQMIGGFVQSTGWPSVLTCVANWFGKGQRGLIMGIWNSHTSFGNIIGSVIAGSFASHNWGLSFIVPGIIIAALGILVLLFLVPHPEDIDCGLPDHAGSSGGQTDQSDSDSELSGAGDVGTGDINRVQREGRPLLHPDSPTVAIEDAKAISFLAALKIPGVIEFSLCLFFAKLVSYVFLYWLPDYIYNTTKYNAELSADMSTVFDFGGIIGGIMAGVISDHTLGRATTCVIMLFLAGPMLFVYESFGAVSVTANVFLLLIVGFLVNGPYALITTAVSADLGTHKSLRGNAKALATVTSIIDGTGSLGAAVGPLLAGLFSASSWSNVFYMLIAADVVAMLLLVRLVIKELKPRCSPRLSEHV